MYNVTKLAWTLAALIHPGVCTAPLGVCMDPYRALGASIASMQPPDSILPL